MTSVKSVVVADDDRFIVDSIKNLLEGTCLNFVGGCANGLDLMKMCEDKKPDIALVDIAMPVMDGIKATEKIVKEDLAKCVIVLTSFGDTEYVQGAIDAGASGYLTKPLNKDILIPTIESSYRQSAKIYDANKKSANVHKRLETREVIERAKLVLMENEGLSEEDAYGQIKSMSKDRGKSMADISELIIAKYVE